MVFSGLEPMVLTTENITTDSVYTITEQGKIIEANPSSVPEVANEVRDVYVHTDDVPIEVNITLDAGSICVANLLDFTEQCLTQSGETFSHVYPSSITLSITGSRDSRYTPLFLVGDGTERFAVDSTVESVYQHFLIGDTMYRLFWFASHYHEQYLSHIRREINRLNEPFERYASGYCPCETFDPSNPSHFDPAEKDRICPIPGFADDYWPRRIEDAPNVETLYHCPREPSQQQWSEYEDFHSKGLIAFAKLFIKASIIEAQLFYRDIKMRPHLLEIANSIIGADQSTRLLYDRELITQLTRSQHIINQLRYLVEH